MFIYSLFVHGAINLRQPQLLQRTCRRPYLVPLSADDAYLNLLRETTQAAETQLVLLPPAIASHRHGCPRLYCLTHTQLADLVTLPNHVDTLHDMLPHVCHDKTLIIRAIPLQYKPYQSILWKYPYFYKA